MNVNLLVVGIMAHYWNCGYTIGMVWFKYAVSTLNYFLIEVFSFPLNLVCSLRGRNVLNERGFVTPHPEKVHGTCNCRGTKCHCNIFGSCY